MSSMVEVSDQSGDSEVSKIVFVALHIAGGNVGMLLLFATILCSRQVIRHATFVNFCATWILYSLSYLLLFYAGEMQNPQPRFSLCVTQAAMIYGAPAATSISGFIFVLYTFLVLRRAVLGHAPYNSTKLVMTTMLATPYIVYFAIFVIVLIIGINNPQTIHRSPYYCTTKLVSVARIAPGISGVAVTGAVIMEMMIGFTLHQHWRAFRKIYRGPSGILTMNFMIRGMLFTLISFSGLLATLAFLLHFKMDPVANIVIAILPISAFLTYGTQSDILRAWHIRREFTPNPSNPQTHQKSEISAA